MLGRPPNRIDLLTSIDGVTFEECWNRRQIGTLDDLDTFFISQEDFIANKRAAERLLKFTIV